MEDCGCGDGAQSAESVCGGILRVLLLASMDGTADSALGRSLTAGGLFLPTCDGAVVDNPTEDCSGAPDAGVKSRSIFCALWSEEEVASERTGDGATLS